MELSFNHQLVETFNLPSITNTRYGIKGQTKEIAGFVENPSKIREMQIQFHYKSSDKNGTGYLDYFLLGFPFSSLEIGAGIYYNLNVEPFNLKMQPSHIAWDISSFFEVKDISSPNSIQS